MSSLSLPAVFSVVVTAISLSDVCGSCKKVCGGFRRGKKKCHDVDILVSFQRGNGDSGHVKFVEVKKSGVLRILNEPPNVCRSVPAVFWEDASRFEDPDTGFPGRRHSVSNGSVGLLKMYGKVSIAGVDFEGHFSSCFPSLFFLQDFLLLLFEY